MTRRRAQVTRQAFENLTNRPRRDCDGLPDRQEEGMNSKEEKWPLGRIGEGGACWTGWAGEREERRERRERTGAKDGPTSHDYFFSFSAVLIHGGAGWSRPSTTRASSCQVSCWGASAWRQRLALSDHECIFLSI